MYAVVSFLDTAGMMEKALPFTYPNSLTVRFPSYRIPVLRVVVD